MFWASSGESRWEIKNRLRVLGGFEKAHLRVAGPQLSCEIRPLLFSAEDNKSSCLVTLLSFGYFGFLFPVRKKSALFLSKRPCPTSISMWSHQNDFFLWAEGLYISQTTVRLFWSVLDFGIGLTHHLVAVIITLYHSLWSGLTRRNVGVSEKSLWTETATNVSVIHGSFPAAPLFLPLCFMLSSPLQDLPQPDWIRHLRLYRLWGQQAGVTWEKNRKGDDVRFLLRVQVHGIVISPLH